MGSAVDGETTIKVELSCLRGSGIGDRGKLSQNAVSHGKRHDNQILKVQISWVRNPVVIA